MKARKTIPASKPATRELVAHLPDEQAFKSLGIRFPNDQELEQAVLGATLVTTGAFLALKRILPKEAFWLEKHQTVYVAMEQITKRGDAIDLMTVTAEVQKMGLLFSENTLASMTGKNQEHYRLFAVSGIEIIECANKVASAAHLESHCRLLYELFMRRKAIVEGWGAIKNAESLSFDVFNLYAHLEREIRIANPHRIIRVQDMNEVLDEGAKESPSRWMCGNLVKENEVCILFGDEGTGKSVLAFQMGDAVSRGKAIFPVPGFENHCEPKFTIFYDFELEPSELFARYSFHNEKHMFHENFKRGSLSNDFLDLETMDQAIIHEIQRDIEIHKPRFVIIDNITYIISESQDPLVATNLMKKLLALQRKHKLTILVIAHTPKRDLSMPIENRHLAGAKNLSNFAKSVIAVSHSKKDIDKRYIKHTKCRNGRKLHDESNVIECVLLKEGAMLQYEFHGTGPEQPHLTVKDFSEIEKSAIQFAYDERKKKRTSYRTLADQISTIYDIEWSHTTIKRKVEEHIRKNNLSWLPEPPDDSAEKDDNKEGLESGDPSIGTDAE